MGAATGKIYFHLLILKYPLVKKLQQQHILAYSKGDIS